MESIWRQTVKIKERPALSGNIGVQAAVIGAGLAGVLTAYFLQQRGIDTVVLEAGRIASGQTQNTTAKITSQHDLIYSRLIQDFGEHKARQYADANQRAIQEYQRIIQEQNIDCAFEICPAYLYSQTQRDVLKLEEEVKAAQRLGIPSEFTTYTQLPFPVAGAVKFHEQAQFHPLAFIEAISAQLNIFEQTRALQVDDDRITTESGTVTAKHIVFATHFPFINVPGFYFARMHQQRSYVLALQGPQELDGMYLGTDADALSFRNGPGCLLLGGGGHRTGENSAGGKYAFLREKAHTLYPQSTEISHWSAQDCITLDGVPYIGPFSATAPRWYVATGFRKWGMSSSMVSALLISDGIERKVNPFAEIFHPSRFTPSVSMKTFFSDMGQAVKGIARQAFAVPKEALDDVEAGQGGVIEAHGEKIGVYKDEQSRVYAVSVRCPHLGCQLEWNPDEKSWDCPCHGSRFDYKGNLLDNPAQTDLERIRHE